MLDPRNRVWLIGSVVAGLVTFVLLWWLGVWPFLAWMAAWSLPTFAMYGIDKRQAEQGGWRVPEVLLHGLALIGGVVGAWAGRQLFRHKTQKREFTVVLALAGVLWLLIAAWILFG